jgi:amino acid transporter
MRFIPGENAAWWSVSAMTVTLLCVEYLSIFGALLRLRYAQPDAKRSFGIFGGIVGVRIVGGSGFVAAALTFITGLLPIGGIATSGPPDGVILVDGTTLLALAPPHNPRR